jgi:hypothetical protein
MTPQMLTLAMERAQGYPIAAAPTPPPAAAAVLNPAVFPTGQCPAAGHSWGINSVCLKDTKAPAGAFGWHCPWESMMLLNAKKLGGCARFKYECTGTNVEALLKLYDDHDTMGPNHPPEGSLKTVEYVACCIRNQCKAGPTCGAPTWVDGVSVSPFVGTANPCGKAGCERLFSISTVLKFIPKARPTTPVAVVSLLVAAGVLLTIRRRASHSHVDHQVLIQSDVHDEEAADIE